MYWFDSDFLTDSTANFNGYGNQQTISTCLVHCYQYTQKIHCVKKTDKVLVGQCIYIEAMK